MNRKVKDWVISNSYILIIVITVIVYFFFSFLSFEDGELVFNDFSNYTALDWIFYAFNIILPTVLGLTINNSFRSLGYKEYRNHPEIKPMYEEMRKLEEAKKEKTKKSLTVEEYMRRQGPKQAVAKTLFGVVTSALTISMIIQASWAKVLPIMLVLSMWLVMGYTEMVKVYDYGLYEGRDAMQKLINERKKEWQQSKSISTSSETTSTPE